MGAVVLMLFARQVITPSRAACDAQRSAAPAAGDVAMHHQQHGSTHGAPSQAPSPKRGSPCDHSPSDSNCCIGIGCAPAVIGAPVAAVAPRPIQPLAIPAPAARVLSPAFAPDVPPPRA